MVGKLNCALKSIKITGAREHNLKDISLELPRGKLVVITGVSGSGKSSLAFDTIFSEGQRRYMESLSAYARQFVEKTDKPDLDAIEGLSPSIAVDQKTFQRNPRSTVGTTTEIYDFLRLLFARIGKPYCYGCGADIHVPASPQGSAQGIEKMASRVVAALGRNEKAYIFSPIVQGRKGEYRKELEELRKDGFVKVRIDGELRDLDEDIKLSRHKKHTIEILIDVILIRDSGKDVMGRIVESLRMALKRSGGTVIVESGKRIDAPEQGGEVLNFSEKLNCPKCEISYREISPRLFSFNSPYGSCSDCHGIGETSYCEPELCIDEEASIANGAIIPWANSDYFNKLIKNLAETFEISLNTPFKDLSAKAKKLIIHGSSGKNVTFHRKGNSKILGYQGNYVGVVGIISHWYRETESSHVREKLSQYMRVTSCNSCQGSRLNKQALSVLIEDRSIHNVNKMSVDECLEFFQNVGFTKRQREIADRIVREIHSRLTFLVDVGLGYLTLNRSAPTLSGGEAQRIRLATQVGSKLTGITYVLDEPTVGLHARDNLRLIKTLKSLRDAGNTVIVVEHDEETIRSADYIIDVGPGAGEKGGKIVAEGGVKELARRRESLTGSYLSRNLSIPAPLERRKPKGFISIKGASEHNLKNVDVAFPIGVFTCVTGVSGSGKSTLVLETLFNVLNNKLYHGKKTVGAYKAISGEDNINKVAHVEQTPIGRTPRSNPATYTGIFSPIRELFSMLPQANAKGYEPGRFSFNVKDGRCAACLGHGVVKIEMHFLPDVYVTCERCGGSRYNSETLKVKYKGKSIAEVLNMTVREASEFFQNVPHIKSKLEVLEAVGLEYIRLGQPATTLSGGESQRIKLSKELARRQTGKTLYIIDEPTIGLHFEDVKKLLLIIQQLVKAGNSVIVIEHNLDVIKCADYVIDMGPEGGEAGGMIIASGTPEEVAEVGKSYTGRFLKEILNKEVVDKRIH